MKNLPSRTGNKLGILSCVLLASASANAAVFQSGELDFGAVLKAGGEFEIEAHVVSGVVDGTNTVDVEFETSDIQVLVSADTRLLAPANVPSAGVSAGDPLWLLPQEEVAGVPYVALASEELIAGDWLTPITFTLGSVVSPSGSGAFSVFEVDAFLNSTVHFSSLGDAFTADNNQFTSNFGHSHLNWTFNEVGTWTVDLEASGEHATLGQLATTSTLTFNVVPEPSSTLLAGLGLAVGLIRRRR